MKIMMISLVSLTTCFLQADSLYDASLGTLPQAQGFTYSGDNGNPSPFVSSGSLHENTTAGVQYWSVSNPAIDFSQSTILQASLLINSSNYVPMLGDGTTREGYYLGIQDKNGNAYSIGLASDGYALNSVSIPNRPLSPYTIAGALRTYILTINNNSASFFIDGKLIQSNIAPQPDAFHATEALFGGVAGLSRSDSELQSFCYGDSASACTSSSATPEPRSSLLILAGLASLIFIGRRCNSTRRT